MPRASPCSRAIALATTAALHLLLLFLLIIGSVPRGTGSHSTGASGELLVEATIAPPLPHHTKSSTTAGESKAEHTSPGLLSPSILPQTASTSSGSSTQPRSTTSSDDSFRIGSVAGQESDFERRLLTHIERFRHYPDRAKQQGVFGQVQVTFTMDRSGNVLAISITGSSGSPVLDTEAVNTVLRAQPLPAIPSNLPDTLEVELPVSFDPGQSGALAVMQ